MRKEPCILLSFDVEEFDMPLEYGQQLSAEEQMQVGGAGLQAVMSIMDELPHPATFFTTANFAEHFPNDLRQIARRHEVASHTYYHTTFTNEDLLSSRLALERITGTPVTGLRMPRLRPVEIREVLQAGYRYDSSINPTWLPGRYNNLSLPRRPYMQEGLLRVPVSVSAHLRIPLFWLSFKNFNYNFYFSLVRRALERDGYVCLYFHPWEFVPLDRYVLPGYAKRLAGTALQQRFRRLLADLSQCGKFITMNEFAQKLNGQGRGAPSPALKFAGMR